MFSKMSSVQTASCSRIFPCGHRCTNSCWGQCTATICMELVPSQINCPRGHRIILHCNTVTTASNPTSDAQDEYVLRQCTQPCGMTLECGHRCKSTCGNCYNSRLHMKCTEPCQKSLVCGHLCKEPCSNVCPPCQDHCEIRCDHTKCDEKCGIKCFACTERCTSMCQHSKCSMKCGEFCNRKACEEPCPKMLHCGHSCIGLCGERCPPLCRTCNKEEVTKPIFGTEEEKTARFVLLEDCGHTFESEALEQWVKDSGTVIGMKKCPTCGTPIYNTRRYHNYILLAFEEVQSVKSKFFTVDKSALRGDVFLLARLNQDWREEVEDLPSKLGQNLDDDQITKVSDIEFSLYLFRRDVLKLASDVKNKLKEKPLFMHPLFGKLNSLVRTIFDTSGCVANQLREEAVCEIRRISILASVDELQTKNQHETVRQMLRSIRTEMYPSTKFTTDSEKRVHYFLKEAEKYVGCLGITEQERVMIALAMGFKQGQWYRCLNGHIYTIGDCGRPSSFGICPECRTAIGGSNHSLISGNSVAIEMNEALRQVGLF